MSAETFCEQFATFAEAPNGVEKLREMILQLAAIGKLCPQNSLEESASELLAKIRDAVKIRYASGEIRRRENSLACDIQADLIPDGWSYVSLGEIADVNWGNTTLTKSSYTETGVTAYSAAGPDGFIGHAEFSGPGIVLSAIGARSGKCFLADGQWTAIKNTITIIPFAPISNDWLFRTVNRELAWTKRGGAQPFIALKDAVSLPILLPPLAEQKRIVAKVDQLLALCDELASRQAARREARVRLVGATLDRLVTTMSTADVGRVGDNFDQLFDTPTTIPQLRQTILQLAVQGRLIQQNPADEPAARSLERMERLRQEMVDAKTIKVIDCPPISDEDIEHHIPDSWQWSRLGHVCKLLTDGTHYTPKYTTEGRMFLSAQNVKPFSFQPETHRYVSEADYQEYVKNKKAEFEDVLLTRVGAGIGEAAVINLRLDFAFYVSLGLLRPFRECLDPHFLALWLNSPIGRRHSQRNTLGKGVSQGNLNLGLIRAFVIPIPPLAEQKRIVAKVTDLLSLCDALEAKLKQTECTSTTFLSAAVASLTQR